MSEPRAYYITHPKLYQAWSRMRDRVNNPNATGYKYWGGRGIKHQFSWNKIENFVTDMGATFVDGLTLDRIDPNGDYTKENCRWLSKADQNRNRRDNIKYKGETTAEASRRLGGGKNIVNQRISIYGWSLEDAFTKPVEIENRKHARTSNK